MLSLRPSLYDCLIRSTVNIVLHPVSISHIVLLEGKSGLINNNVTFFFYVLPLIIYCSKQKHFPIILILLEGLGHCFLGGHKQSLGLMGNALVFTSAIQDVNSKLDPELWLWVMDWHTTQCKIIAQDTNNCLYHPMSYALQYHIYRSAKLHMSYFWSGFLTVFWEEMWGDHTFLVASLSRFE